eukprot:117221_1
MHRFQCAVNSEQIVTNHQYIKLSGSETQLHSHEICWKWLDLCVLYLPMYCPSTPSGTPRNVLLCIIYNASNLCIIPSLVLICLYWFYFDDVTAYKINIVCYYGLALISKIFALYYFYFNFKYPWHHTPLLSVTCTDRCSHHIQSRSCITFLLLMVWLIAQIIYALYVALFATNYRYYVTIGNIVYLFVGLLPMIMVYCVHTAICCQYEHYMSHFTNIISSISCGSCNVCISDVFDEYMALYDSFGQHYPASLKYAIWFHLSAMFFLGWFSGFYVIEMGEQNISFSRIATIVWNVLSMGTTILLYSIASININDQTYALEQALWKYALVSRIGGNINSSEQYDIQLFFQCINRNRIGINPGNVIVTKKKIATLLIMFVVLRYVSYSAYILYK